MADQHKAPVGAIGLEQQMLNRVAVDPHKLLAPDLQVLSRVAANRHKVPALALALALEVMLELELVPVRVVVPVPVLAVMLMLVPVLDLRVHHRVHQYRVLGIHGTQQAQHQREQVLLHNTLVPLIP